MCRIDCLRVKKIRLICKHLRATKNATKFAGKRVHIMRALSTEAAEKFPDEHFDWIYIDALHTRDAVVKDLRLWWPKLRPYGMISGDDFGNMGDTKCNPQERFAGKMCTA